MELPNQLKTLYKHWSSHTKKISIPINSEDIFKDKMLFENISWFIQERNTIWQKKVSEENPPHTKDKVLSTYRFCNMFREFDKQTIEFHTFLKPIEHDFSLWLLNMFYCRMVARPQTIQDIGLLSFDEKNNKEVYKKLMEHLRPKYGVPYVFPVSVIMKSDTPTRELFITKYLPSVMKKVAEEITSWDKKSVYDGVEKVVSIFDFNLRFLWTEVLIDVAYQYPEYIDLFKRFPVGPGSLPTLKKIDANEDPSILVTKLSRINFDTGITFNDEPLRLSAENWEGVGCEYRKYCNLKEGKGRKRLFE